MYLKAGRPWKQSHKTIPSDISSLEAESKQEMGPGYKTWKPGSSDILLLVSLCLYSVPSPSQTTAPAEDQVFKLKPWHQKAKLREENRIWITLRGETVHHGQGRYWLSVEWQCPDGSSPPPFIEHATPARSGCSVKPLQVSLKTYRDLCLLSRSRSSHTDEDWASINNPPDWGLFSRGQPLLPVWAAATMHNRSGYLGLASEHSPG